MAPRRLVPSLCEMTGKADFTAEEWELLREGPPTAGMVALMAEHGGTFRETWALAKAYTEARQEHGENELLDALVSEKPDVKRYKTPEEAESQGLGPADRGDRAARAEGDRRRGDRLPQVRRSTSPSASPKRTRKAATR